MKIHLTQEIARSFVPEGTHPRKGFVLTATNHRGLSVKVHGFRGKGEPTEPWKDRYWLYRYSVRSVPTLTERPSWHAAPGTQRDYVIAPLYQMRRMRDALAELACLKALVARGGDPLGDRQHDLRKARVQNTLIALARHEMKVWFNTSWEKPESCMQSERDSATTQRRNWREHILPALGARTPPAAVTVTRIDQMLAGVREQKGDHVAASVRGCLRASLTRARKWGLIDRPGWTNPVSDSKPIPTAIRREHVMSTVQYQAAMAAAEELLAGLDPNGRYYLSHARQYLVILTTLEVGRRPGEIMALRRTNVLYEEKSVYLPKTKADKHTAERINGQTFFLTERAIGYLRQAEALAGGSDYVFPAGGWRGHLNRIDRIWRKVRDRAGIGPEIVLYTGRHRRITAFRAARP